MSRQNEWRKRHLAECAAYMREWRKRRKDLYREWAKLNRAKNPERHKTANRKWRASEKGKAWLAKWSEGNRDLVNKARDRAEQKRKFRKITDAEYYAHFRAVRRLAKAMRGLGRGKIYRPILSRRIPDWACMGEKIADYGSRFLINNQTIEQRAYARELYRERYPR